MNKRVQNLAQVQMWMIYNLIEIYNSENDSVNKLIWYLIITMWD